MEILLNIIILMIILRVLITIVVPVWMIIFIGVKKVKWFFAWYDFWGGLYWDRKERVLYFCPIPMVCLSMYFNDKRYNRKKQPSPYSYNEDDWYNKEEMER